MVKTFPPLVILLSGKIKKSNGFQLSFPSVSVTTAPSACYQLKLGHNHVQQTTVLNPHPTPHSGSETPSAAGNSVVSQTQPRWEIVTESSKTGLDRSPARRGLIP